MQQNLLAALNTLFLASVPVVVDATVQQMQGVFSRVIAAVLIMMLQIIVCLPLLLLLLLLLLRLLLLDYAAASSLLLRLLLQLQLLMHLGVVGVTVVTAAAFMREAMVVSISLGWRWRDKLKGEAASKNSGI